MIPPGVREVAAGPVWLIVASRDAAFRPTADYAFGVRVEDDEHIDFVVPEVRAESLKQRLRVSPRVALGLNSHAEVRCFQVKGEVIETRAGDGMADGLCDIHAARLATVNSPLAKATHAFRRRPSTVFRMRVDESFDQTPGPGAGRRVGEPPDPVAEDDRPVTAKESSLRSMPAELRAVLEATAVGTVATCSRAGEPNATVISEIWWVDATHVALSFQFFNKTIRNIRENPVASAKIIDPRHLVTWNLDLGFLRSETSGPIFDAMDMRLEAIASMTGMTGVFRLRAADVYGVHSVRRNDEEFL